MSHSRPPERLHPPAEQPSPPIQRAAGNAAPASAWRVLVVDDCVLIRELLCVALEREGFDVRCAADGVAALELMSAERPDAIVCDLHMPGMNGLSLLRQVREHERCSRVPLLLLTVESSGPASEAARSAGASAFMSKPFRAPEVAAAVRRLVAGSAVRAGLPA